MPVDFSKIRSLEAFASEVVNSTQWPNNPDKELVRSLLAFWEETFHDNVTLSMAIWDNFVQWTNAASIKAPLIQLLWLNMPAKITKVSNEW